MKKINNILIINFIIFFCLIVMYFEVVNKIFLFILISVLIFINLIIIYKKSNSFDEKEIKQKIILHRIKNSLSIILGYNEALKDNLIELNNFEKEVNKEIEKIILIIKDEIYRK